MAISILPPSRRQHVVAVLFLLTCALCRRSNGFCPPFHLDNKPISVSLRQSHGRFPTGVVLKEQPNHHDNNNKEDHSNITYDAIIIGSGMSGLIAGNYLAREGHKVLLVEQHSLPGGYTTNFHRHGDFRFEVSTHLINGCDPDGTVGRILRSFHVADQIEFVPLQQLLRWIDPARHMDTVIPLGIHAYVDTLVRLFPHEEQGIREFHNRYYPLAEWVLEYGKRRGLNQIIHVLQHLPLLFRLLSLQHKTAADILDPLIKDPACRELMTVMTALFGLHYTELDAAIFIMGSLMFHAGGAYYPIGGSGQLAKVLAHRFSEYGGDLRLKMHVDTIEFNDNKNDAADGVVTTATGVQMKDASKGETVVERARCIIHASDLATMVNSLVPHGIFPEYYVKSVQKRVPGNSLVVAWAGLDMDLKNDKGIQDFEIIRTNNKSQESKDMLERILKTADYGDLPVSGATIYSNVDPSCCPPGKSVISTNFMASYDTFARTLDGSPSGRRGRDSGSSRKYHKLKEKVKAQLIDQMAKATGISDLADHVEVMEVATPLTFHRYTENLGGSYMGWRLTPAQGAFSSFSPKTPIRNLFACGQWLGVGGVSNVMTNGLEAGKLASRYLDRLDRSRKH
jgi:phytoene dehydrogenase-like protein